MKSLFIGIALTLSSAALGATDTFTCEMKDTSARPYLTFLVKTFPGNKAAITYVRSAFYGSEEVQFERPISGCEKTQVDTVKIDARSIYVECAGDGDAGYLSAKLNGESLLYAGAMHFPNSGVEGFDDTSIPVSCVKNR